MAAQLASGRVALGQPTLQAVHVDPRHGAAALARGGQGWTRVPADAAEPGATVPPGDGQGRLAAQVAAAALRLHPPDGTLASRSKHMKTSPCTSLAPRPDRHWVRRHRRSCHVKGHFSRCSPRQSPCRSPGPAAAFRPPGLRLALRLAWRAWRRARAAC